MDLYPLTLRVLHIGGAMFWAGASWTLAGFLTPAIRDVQPGGPAVMKYVMQQRSLSEVFSVAALANTLTGLLLFWRASSGLNLTWISSGHGLALSLGGLAGLTAFFIGFFVNRPLSKKMGAIGAKIEASQGKPAPELISQMGQLQSKMEQAGVWTSILLAVAVIAMASAQSVYF